MKKIETKFYTQAQYGPFSIRPNPASMNNQRDNVRVTSFYAAFKAAGIPSLPNNLNTKDIAALTEIQNVIRTKLRANKQTPGL